MSNSISEKLDEFVNELHTEYELWYAKSVRRNYLWWYILQIVSAISGLFFALASAIAVSGVLKDTPNSTNDNPKLTMLLVLLPALSSACANIIIRFRIYDLWMIREQGRIKFQKLHKEALGKAASAKDDNERSALYQDLVERAEIIENEQQTRFFSIAGSDLSANNANSQNQNNNTNNQTNNANNQTNNANNQNNNANNQNNNSNNQPPE